VNVARNAIVDKRKDLDSRAQMLTAQWIEVRDNQLARRAELNQVQADIAEIDAWLAANPAI
jgi:hypothetical protein